MPESAHLDFEGQSLLVYPIGTVLDFRYEGSTCPIDGSHLHQSSANSTSSRPNKTGDIPGRAPFWLTWSFGDDFPTVAGVTAEVWTGAGIDPPLATALPASVTAVFHWNGAINAFDFWFRGFPDAFNTLHSIATGWKYHFQSSGTDVIPVADDGAFVNYEPGEAFIETTNGAVEAVWSGNTHPALAYWDTVPLPVSAVFKWNNFTQLFQYWFRGFPPEFQSLPSGTRPR